MRPTALTLALLTFCSPAMAEDEVSACETVAGWTETCDVASTLKVVGLATERLAALNDCADLKKTALSECAAQATALGTTMSQAALSLHTAMAKKAEAAGEVAAKTEAKTGKASRNVSAGAMEAEETDE